MFLVTPVYARIIRTYYTSTGIKSWCHLSLHSIKLRLVLIEQSPRWTTRSGNRRMLLVLVLVRELESRRGEILNLFAKIKRDQLLRAPNNSVGKHNSTRVDEGRKS